MPVMDADAVCSRRYQLMDACCSKKIESPVHSADPNFWMEVFDRDCYA